MQTTTKTKTMSMPVRSQTFFGDETETYYVDHRLTIWLVQSPDMRGVDPVEFDALPDGVTQICARLLDQDLRDCALKIDRAECKGTIRVDGDTAFVLLGLDYRTDAEHLADSVDHIAALYREWLAKEGFENMTVVADKRSDYGTRIDRDSADFWARHEDDLAKHVHDSLTSEKAEA